MVREKLEKDTRKALLNARGLIEEIIEADSNEAVTRQRVEHIFETCMGYDVLKHITPEFAIHGVGDTEYCDLAIRLDEKEAPIMLVEVKRVKTELSIKHLKQVCSYAINKGCEWALLTNGKEWRIYHISFDQPPQTTLVDSWSIFDDDLSIIADKFSLICYRSLKRDSLNLLWTKTNVLTPHNILKTIFSENSLLLIKRSLRRTKKGVSVSPEEVVSAIKRLLNETALAELENIKISLGTKKRKSHSTAKTDEVQEVRKKN
jgi:predicted type IV restriction endonuclease